MMNQEKWCGQMEDETFRAIKEVIGAVQHSGGSLESVVAEIIEHHNNDLTSDQKLQLASKLISSSRDLNLVHKKVVWENDYF
ncbi:MAG TPA: hypothetical protein VI968_02185 [archaeon]|nr:hypothetical protein [archaeon]